MDTTEMKYSSEVTSASVCNSFPPASESRKAECRKIKENSEVEYSFPNV